MHQNIALQTPFYNTSETNDSAKQDLPNPTENPFAFTLVTNALSLSRSPSLRAPWTNLQKENYSIFCCYFREILMNQSSVSSSWNLFKAMAQFIKTRNPQQCRSHHLKLLKQFDGIQSFISRIIKRIRRLNEKMHLAQKILIDIQQEFQLYFEGSPQNTEQKQNFFHELLLAQRNQTAHQVVQAQEKYDKQEFKKTAASYEQAQNPVKNNNIFSSLSQLKSFSNSKTKKSRASLPSFECEEKIEENDNNPKPMRGESERSFMKGFQEFYGQNEEIQEGGANFDTFMVPQCIKTTSQMYSLWQSSIIEQGNKKSQEKV